MTPLVSQGCIPGAPSGAELAGFGGSARFLERDDAVVRGAGLFLWRPGPHSFRAPSCGRSGAPTKRCVVGTAAPRRGFAREGPEPPSPRGYEIAHTQQQPQPQTAGIKKGHRTQVHHHITARSVDELLQASGQRRAGPDVQFAVELDDEQVAVRLVRPGPKPLRVLRLTRLDRLFTLIDDLPAGPAHPGQDLSA